MLKTALDLSKLTTRKGAKIEVHFEDAEGEALLKEQYSHSEFLRKVNKDVDEWGRDNGQDTIHFLLNNQGIASLMTEAYYAEWQAASEKDWFHEEAVQVIVLGGFPEDLLFEALFSHQLNKGPKFVGMPEEEFDEFTNNPENVEKVATMLGSDHSCNLCPIPWCPGRDQSFDKLAFEKTFQETTATEK